MAARPHVRGYPQKATVVRSYECQWLLGFLRQHQVEKDELVKKNMLEYLVELLQDAVDISWHAAKGAHYIVVNRIIEGLATRKDLDSVQKIRERNVKTTNVSQNSTKTNRTCLRQVPCFKYNKRGGCGENQDHIFKDMLLRHACQLCHQITGKFEDHARKNCPRNYQNHASQSKNM